MIKYVYWISYEIRSREHGRTFEENSFIAKMSPAQLSLRAIKTYVLKHHGFDPQQHYVRIVAFENLGAMHNENN